MSDLQIGQAIYRQEYVDGLERDLDREREARRIVDLALRQAISVQGAIANIRVRFEGPEFFEHDQLLCKNLTEVLQIIYESRVKS